MMPEPPERPEPALEAAAGRAAAGWAAAGLAGYAQVVLLTMAVATTSLSYLRYFSGRDFLIATLAAAAGGALVGGVAAARRWGAGRTAALAVAGFVPVAVFAVLRSTLQRGIPTPRTATEFWIGLVSGWSRMLSVGLPAEPAGELTFTPALLTWLAAVLGTTAVLRTRTVLLPLLAPLLAFGAALLLTAARPVGGPVLTAVLLAELLLLALVRAGHTDPVTGAGLRRAGGAWGRFALGLPVVLAAVAVGVVGARMIPLATAQHRFDPRDSVPIKLDIGDSITPLAGLKAQLRDPERELFRVRLRGDSAGVDRVRTATLDHFDGSLWTSTDRFLLAGRTLAGPENLTNPRHVSATVTIGDLPGPYLPVAGWPVRVTRAEVPRFGYSAESGTLATDAPTLAGLTYDLDVELGSDEGLDNAVPERSAGAGRYIELPPDPPVPAELRAKGAELVGPVARPYAKLTALRDYLRDMPYSLDARPGHSYDALRRLLSAHPADRVGYAEQFAAAFAVLARSQGFPARVAVGYLLRPAEQDGGHLVRSGDAHAWAEVNFAGHGWTVFDPTDPQRRGSTTQKPPEEEEAGKRKDQPDAQAAASQPGEDPNLPKLLAGRVTVLDWALWVLIGIGVLAVLIPVMVAAEKFRRRRRRRRTGSHAARIIGAWLEATDKLTQHGVGVSAASTAQEIAQQAQARLGEGAGSVAVLAPLVSAALYSPVAPDDGAVQQAWQLDRTLRRDLRRSRGPLPAIRGWIDPRPLFARRRDARRRRRALDRLTRG